MVIHRLKKGQEPWDGHDRLQAEGTGNCKSNRPETQPVNKSIVVIYS